MKRADISIITLLLAAILIIYFGVFTADYLYTDEATQLLYFKTGLNSNTSVPQGRYFFYKLFACIFNTILTIHDVRKARPFCLLGWMACLPVWYYIINQLAIKNGLPKMLAICALISLISMPSLAISIGWSACMEDFIAYTAGLFSGYMLYAGISLKNKLCIYPRFPFCYLSCLV